MQAELFIKASDQAAFKYVHLQEESGQDGVILLNADDAVSLVGINVPGRNVITLVNRGDSAIALVANSTEAAVAYRFGAAVSIPAYGEVKLVSAAGIGWTPIAVGGLLGTFSLANLTDPGSGVASAAIGGAMGALIFGYVSVAASDVAQNCQTFAIETGQATGVYTDVLIAGTHFGFPSEAGGADIPFAFFVPTGRRWKHTVTGTAPIGALSAELF